MMYKTRSLDTAAYIHSQGEECRIKPLNDSHSEFCFKGEKAPKLAKKYLAGQVVMSLHKYQYSRTHLKNLANKENGTRKRQLEINKPARPKASFVIMDQKPYYYVENGMVKEAVYKSGDPVQATRVNQGNAYQTYQEAYKRATL